MNVDLQHPLKTVCAWHPRYFGKERVIREAAPGRENDGVSDGICDECKLILLAGGKNHGERRTGRDRRQP